MHLLHPKRSLPPLKNVDCDYKISLVDIGQVDPTRASISSSKRRYSSDLNQEFEDSHNLKYRRHETPIHFRRKLSKWKLSKHQSRGRTKKAPSRRNLLSLNQGNNYSEVDLGQVRSQNNGPSEIQNVFRSPDFAVDVLYENQRGGLICGLPLFSSRALCNLDPAPWTNIANKTSATNITNAQPPDPSWQWVENRWSIYHSSEVGEDGWLYSFAFHGRFSWHRPRWWNSFVRKRAWVRKRARKKGDYNDNELSMFNPDYFIVNSPPSSHQIQKYAIRAVSPNVSSISPDGQELGNEPIEKITYINTLMKVLRLARIDREIIEAVENFIENGGENLVFLKSQIPYIMQLCIFQESRRSLLALLKEKLKQAREKSQDIITSKTNLQSHIEHLESSLHAAVEEATKYEFESGILNEILQKNT